MTNYMKNGGIFLISGLVALAAAELGLRWLWNPGPQAVLMMSRPSMVMAADGVVTYAPDTRLRVITADRQGIIYDVTARTNNVGMVDDEPYALGDEGYRIAVVGDSYTAGYHGGQPWIPRLRERLPEDWELLGLGVSGTGVQHFDALLAHIDPAAVLDQVLVVAIGNDFYRDHWYLTSGSEGIWFCDSRTSVDQCSEGRPPIIHYLPDGASEREVLDLAQSRLGEASHPGSFMRLTTLVDIAAVSLFGPDARERLSDPRVVENLDALVRITERYGRDRVTVVHVPALAEVIEGKYDLALETFARSNGIRYFSAFSNCEFEVDMFHAREPHPNAAGYEHLASCVEEALRPLIRTRHEGGDGR